MTRVRARVVRRTARRKGTGGKSVHGSDTARERVSRVGPSRAARIGGDRIGKNRKAVTGRKGSADGSRGKSL